MSWFARTHDRWVPGLLGGCILAGIVLAILPAAEARGPKKPYVPEVIEIELPHMWCSVLKNDQTGAVGDIHILACVPKGTTECNSDLLSLEEPDSD